MAKTKKPQKIVNSNLTSIKKQKSKTFKLNMEHVDEKSLLKKENINIITDKIPWKAKNVVTEDQFSCLWDYYKPHTGLLINPAILKNDTNDWTKLLIEETPAKPIPLSIRRKLKELAKSIYEHEIQQYKKGKEKSQSNESAARWNKIVLSRGSTTDKLAALASYTCQSPLHNLEYLMTQIDYLRPKGRQQYGSITDHLCSQLSSLFLGKHYTLKEFECHNFLLLLPYIKEDSKRLIALKQLFLWYFEDRLLYAYQILINNLGIIIDDTVAEIKIKGINCLIYLVRNFPNQCIEKVLQKLINKLGDINKTVASTVVKSLRSLYKTHHDLNVTIVSLIEELLHRPNLPKRGKYYGLVCLSEVIYRPEEDEKLALKVVKIFLSFFKASSREGEVESKLMETILRGFKRAYNYIGKENSPIIESQLDVLYKLSHITPFNISIQALHIIYQVEVSAFNCLTDRFYMNIYNKIIDPGFGTSSFISAFLNLVYKSMNRDTSSERVQAFCRRLLQVSLYHSCQNACGILYLLSEITKENPDVTDLCKILEGIDSNAKPKVKLDKSNKSSKKRSKKSSTSSNVEEKENQIIKEIRTTTYIPYERSPSYCGAHLSPTWEFEYFKRYFHPTAQIFASHISNKETIPCVGNPLLNYSFRNFLEKFVHRSPKSVTNEGSKRSDIFGTKLKNHPKLHIGSKELLNYRSDRVPADVKFIYTYLKTCQKESTKKEESDSEEEEDSDDKFEELLSKTKFSHYLNPDLDDNEDIDFSKSAGKVGIDKDSDDETMFSNDDEDENSSDGLSEDEFGNPSNELSEDEFEKPSDELSENIVENSTDGLSEDEIEDSFDRLSEDENPFDELSEDEIENGDDDLEMDSDMEDLKLVDDEAPKKRKRWTPKSNQELEDLLMDADDFSQLLEENAEEDGSGTSQAVWNKDKSSTRQMKWEEKRYSGFKGKRTFKKKKVVSKRKNK